MRSDTCKKETLEMLFSNVGEDGREGDHKKDLPQGLGIRYRGMGARERTHQPQKKN